LEKKENGLGVGSMAGGCFSVNGKGPGLKPIFQVYWMGKKKREIRNLWILTDKGAFDAIGSKAASRFGERQLLLRYYGGGEQTYGDNGYSKTIGDCEDLSTEKNRTKRGKTL